MIHGWAKISVGGGAPPIVINDIRNGFEPTVVSTGKDCALFMIRTANSIDIYVSPQLARIDQRLVVALGGTESSPPPQSNVPKTPTSLLLGYSGAWNLLGLPQPLPHLQ